MDIIEKLEVLQNGSGNTPNFYQHRFDHVRDRMIERFNTQITYADWQQINIDIFADAANVKWVDMADRNTTSLYTVEYGGETMLVPYSETAYCVLTVFPRNDPRIIHIRQNSYIQKAQTASDFLYRDQRQAIAADFDRMVPDGAGRLVLPREHVTTTAEAPKPEQYNPFKEALKGFTPPPPPASRAILTVVPKAAPSDGLDPDVVSAFASLNRRFDDQEAEAASDDEAVEEEVARLEARIAQLRTGSSLAGMKREFISSARRMAEDAFGKFRDGVFTSEAAMSFVRLLAAQQEPAPMAQRLLPASKATKGLEGVDPTGPDVVEIRNGRFTTYRLDGIEDRIEGWARRAGVTGGALQYRMRRGLSFREALFHQPNQMMG